MDPPFVPQTIQREAPLPTRGQTEHKIISLTGALVADVDESHWANVGVAHGARGQLAQIHTDAPFTVTLLADSADRYLSAARSPLATHRRQADACT